MSTTTAPLGPSIHSQPGTWSAGQRALTRIAELEALCDLMATRPNALPDARKLADKAGEFLKAARVAARQRPPRSWFGAFIDAIETNIHAAVCLMLRYMPLEALQGWLPELSSLIRAHLPAQDPRRVAVEELLGEDRLQRSLATRRLQAATPGKTGGTPGSKNPLFSRPKPPPALVPGPAAVGASAGSPPEKQTLDESKRETLVTAVHAAMEAQEHEYVRVRSFRNIVYGVTFCLTLLALTLGTVMAVDPRLMPVCFQPEGQIVCPTASEPFASNLDPDPMFEKLARGADYFIIELVGLIAAAVASAVTLRQLRGTSVPYSVPLALALLKLPTGALTAVLGLLLMRGEFLPGLSALDTSAQIIAWAIVFGYAQQLFTRLVDERGQAILNSVGGAENGTLMDQRMSPTPGA